MPRGVILFLFLSASWVCSFQCPGFSLLVSFGGSSTLLLHSGFVFPVYAFPLSYFFLSLRVHLLVFGLDFFFLSPISLVLCVGSCLPLPRLLSLLAFGVFSFTLL